MKLRGTKLYNVWKEMRRRCNNPKHKHYKRYGDRGIKVCKEWGELLKIPYDTLRARLNDYHWSIEKALTTPVRNHKPYRIFVKKGDD